MVIRGGGLFVITSYKKEVLGKKYVWKAHRGSTRPAGSHASFPAQSDDGCPMRSGVRPSLLIHCPGLRSGFFPSGKDSAGATALPVAGMGDGDTTWPQGFPWPAGDRRAQHYLLAVFRRLHLRFRNQEGCSQEKAFSHHPVPPRSHNIYLPPVVKG